MANIVSVLPGKRPAKGSGAKIARVKIKKAISVRTLILNQYFAFAGNLYLYRLLYYSSTVR